MHEDKKPFNDAIDHMEKIEGNSSNLADADFNKMPKPIKFVGYFMIGFFSLSLLMGIILSFIK
ncbi:hypothetical protein ACFOZY_00360 [Chungangia koreensis]|uniref:Amino acid transporter n=1 Tax=Chungangia koreensis TaxID=752657 RepID=A0ABV8X034_9LACT